MEDDYDDNNKGICLGLVFIKLVSLVPVVIRLVMAIKISLISQLNPF